MKLLPLPIYNLESNFAAWFEGYVDFLTVGVYEVYASNDSEARIFINDRLVSKNYDPINAKSQHLSTSESGFKKECAEVHERTAIDIDLQYRLAKET